MEKLSFSDFIASESSARNSSSKTGLYPLSYGGLGVYPDSDYLTHAADAILYLTIDKRLYHNKDKAPFDITHLPGHEQYGDKINNGEDVPFKINHLGGEIRTPKYEMPEGKTVSFKNFIDLVTNPVTISPKASYLPD